MKDKIHFIQLAALLLLVFFFGKLVMSLAGAPYAAGVQVFSMVNLQIHLALVFGAFSRAFKNYGIGGAIQVGILIGLASQILIVIGTALSYPLGGTHFNEPIALNQDVPVGFVAAMGIRAGGLVANCVLSGVAAVIGWGLGTLIPKKS